MVIPWLTCHLKEYNGITILLESILKEKHGIVWLPYSITMVF